MIRAVDVAAVVACVGLAASAAGQVSNWTAGDGLYSDVANWDAGLPLATTSIPTLGMAGAYTVTMDVNPMIDSLDISNPMASLRIDAGRTLTLNGAMSDNDGVVFLNPTGSSANAIITFPGATTMGGTGEIQMQTSFDNSQLNGVGPLTNGGSHLIRGAGQIFVPLNNFGEIRADASATVSGNLLELRDQTMTNNGDLAAANLSVLRFLNIDVNQTPNGRIEALDGGIVRFTSGSVTGGLVTSSGTGFCETESILNVSDVDFDGLFILQPGDSVRVDAGGMTNDGVFELNRVGSAANAVLQFDESASIGGTGEIHLRTQGDNSIIDMLPGMTVTNTAAHTIRGVGQIRANMVNNGEIIADVGVSISGTLLEVQDGGVVNNNLMASAAGSELQIETITIDQTGGGEILARDGGTVDMQNTTVLGGDINTEGSGEIVFSLAGPGDLNSVTFGGNGTINAARTVDVTGTGLTNNGAMQMNPIGSSADSVLRFPAGGALMGSGEILMRTSGGNTRIETTAGTVTQGSSHTIRGVGEINASMLNLGTIAADASASVSGSMLDLADNDKENRGDMIAGDAAVLRIDGVLITQNSGGQMEAQAGGEIEIVNGGGIVGGSVNGAGLLQFSSVGAAPQSLSGVTLNIDSEMISTRRVDVDAGGIVNNGVMRMNPTGSSANSVLAATQNMTIGGNGEIRMLTSGTNTFLSSDLGATMTNGSSHTVRGVGTIDAEFVNDGQVWADTSVVVSGTTLDLSNNTMTNNATLGARDASVLRTLSVDIAQSPSGLFMIDDGGRLEMLAGTVISGGRITGAGTGEARVTGATSIDDVVFDINSLVEAGDTLTVLSAGFENNGLMRVNPIFSSADGVLDMTMGGTLSGTGELSLLVQNANSVLTGNADITNGQMHTISGLGVVNVDLTNNGRVEPGNSTVGNLDFASDYTQSSTGVLEIEINNASAAAADRIDVNGDANLGGEIELSFIEGFVPTGNSTYTVVDAAAVNGTFDNNPRIVNNPFVTRVVYEADRVQVLTRCRADVNLDGVVDPADFTAWLGFFNNNNMLADVNLDDAITPADFTAWLGFFNQPCP